MQLEAVRTRIADLTCVVLTPKPAPPPPELAVVLCHGYGAPGDDLVPLGGELARLLADESEEHARSLRWYFPSAPDAAEGVPFGRAWWQLDMERLIALQRGDPQVGARHEEVPDGMARARRLVTAFVDEVARQTKLPHSRIVLGGFSQGGMIATDVALRHEETPAGLAILSGTLLSATEWRRRALARAGLPVYQSHGRRDPLLPFRDAEALRDLLSEAGLAVDFHAFQGQHELPHSVLHGVASFLASRRPAAPASV